ncbi:MAG: methyltransferase domain-containing protein [Calditrichaeota bacterium]|nr:MAG: methyltransferase domain-containing protein [Calditrichota bacterium]
MDLLSKIGIGAKMGQAVHSEHTASLDESVFYDLRDIIYQASGIYLNDQKKYLIETRLGGRLKELQLKNFQEYLNLLKQPGQGEELHILLDNITVNETSFFRNPPQIKAFEEVIFPQVVENAQKNKLATIRILSAGCSSGEEAYTLAMILLKKFPHVLKQFKVDIIGVDINREVLQQAVQGHFSKFSIRNVPEDYLREFFKPSGTGFQIDDRIRSMARFFKGNISDVSQMSKLGKFSIIFCRNVLIYFDRESKKKTLQNFYNMLHPQGYLFIGHSESLHGISQAFKIILLNKAIVYQHP